MPIKLIYNSNDHHVVCSVITLLIIISNISRISEMNFPGRGGGRPNSALGRKPGSARGGVRQHFLFRYGDILLKMNSFAIFLRTLVVG